MDRLANSTPSASSPGTRSPAPPAPPDGAGDDRSDDAMSTNCSLPSVPTPVATFTDVMLTVVMTLDLDSCLATSSPRRRTRSALRDTASRQISRASSNDSIGTDLRPCTTVLPSMFVRISSLPPAAPADDGGSLPPRLPFRSLPLPSRVSQTIGSPRSSPADVPATRSTSFSLCTSTIVIDRASLYLSVRCPAMVKSCRIACICTPWWCRCPTSGDCASPPSSGTPRGPSPPTRLWVFPAPRWPNASSVTLNPSRLLIRLSSSSAKTSFCPAPGGKTRS
mmetsp:Transcript_12100/g.26295  ORF Transcript_12100/g.26295 Transcript_12100/m.26295 type:complete len:279 (-) Transcript_12100:163-999(-)